jgi:iron complex outermembrane receptor protein
LSNFNQRLGIVEGVRDEYGNLVKSLPGGVEGIPSENDFNSTDPQIPYQHVQHFKAISDNSFKIGSGRLTLNLGWQRNQRMEFGNPDDPEEKNLYFDLQTFNYSTAYHLKDMNGWTTSIGVNGMAQNNQNKGQEVLIPEYDLFDIGGFIYTQKTIDRTTLSGGIRYDYRSLNSKEFIEGNEEKFSPFKNQFSNFSASVGASYAINPNFLLKANLAQGFRAPSIPELASNGAHEGTNRYEYGDQSLGSEISLQGDAGLEINSDHVLFTASVFYNHINNFIFYSKLAGANGGDSLVAADGMLIPAYKFGQHNAHLAGAEFLLDIHPHPLDWLHWQNTFSFVRGLFDESVGGDRDIPFIPAAHWISQLRGEFLKKGKSLRNLSVYFELDNTSKQDHPFTAYQTETSTPGYALMNAGISANIISHNKTLFSIYLNAMNIGDVAYQSSLSRLKYTDVNQVTGRQGVFNMGRNFSIKLNIPLNFNTQK